MVGFLRRVILPTLVILYCASISGAQLASLQGEWKANFKDSLGTGTASISLTVTSSQTVSGTYQSNLGNSGTVAIKQQGSGYRFILTQTTQACSGSFIGEFGLSEGKVSGSYTGTDCNGWHEEGVVTMTLQGGTGSSDPAGSGGHDIQQDAKASTVVIKEIPDDSVLRKPSRIPLTTYQSSSLPHAGDYTLSLRVLQAEQVPYTVQMSGGQISTSCAINGATNTNGMAVASGNVAFGNATSYSSLTMNCNTYETPPSGWRHVLNAMLVVASNGNAYIIACDAAWRWSKCRGLVAGDTFPARMTSKGLEIQYSANDKLKEATYSILQAKVLGQ